MKRQKHKGFRVVFHLEKTFYPEQIWGSVAPENPTVDDVLKFLAEYGGAAAVLDDFYLSDELEVTVDGVSVP